MALSSSCKIFNPTFHFQVSQFLAVLTLLVAIPLVSIICIDFAKSPKKPIISFSNVTFNVLCVAIDKKEQTTFLLNKH